MDAYENDNTYIRYPSNWQKILNTIEYLEQQNIKFIINTVVSNLNILKLDKLLNWIKEKKYLNYFYMLDTPSHYRPTNLPKQVLELAGKRLSNINKENLKKILNDLINKHKTNFKGVGQPLRIALVGSKFGPGIYDIILSLDKNEVIKRLKAVT